MVEIKHKGMTKMLWRGTENERTWHCDVRAASTSVTCSMDLTNLQGDDLAEQRRWTEPPFFPLYTRPFHCAHPCKTPFLHVYNPPWNPVGPLCLYSSPVTAANNVRCAARLPPPVCPSVVSISLQHFSCGLFVHSAHVSIPAPLPLSGPPPAISAAAHCHHWCALLAALTGPHMCMHKYTPPPPPLLPCTGHRCPLYGPPLHLRS